MLTLFSKKALVVVPSVWVCKRRDPMSPEDLNRVKELMAQREQLTRPAIPASTAASAAAASPSEPSSRSGRKIKVKKLDDEPSPFVLQLKRPRSAEEGALAATPGKESEKKKKKPSSEKKSEKKSETPVSEDKATRKKKASAASAVSSSASAPTSDKKKKKHSKRESEDVDDDVDEVVDDKHVSVLRFVGTPDDSAVPLRGTPPEWLFHNWQGAMLVKIPSFPQWPCRIGSTLDLSMFPAASEVPDVQKEVFVYFFGDKTVSWVKYDALTPWPAAEKEQEVLGKINVAKKYAKVWKTGCEEAVEWNRNIALLPPCPAPIDKDPATSIMQPVGKSKKKSIKKVKKKTVAGDAVSKVETAVVVHDPAAPTSERKRPARVAATASGRQRHLKKELGGDLVFVV